MMIKEGRYISLIKASSVAGTGGEALGNLLRLAKKTVSKTQTGIGEVGAGVARGLGKNEAVGRKAGKVLLPAAGTIAAAETDKGKKLRARTGVLTPSEYGGYF